jgi:iron complex outermembrane receptor protein
MCFTSGINAQISSPDIYDLSIGELTKLKVVSVSKSEEKIDEVQSTVRVVTKDEIHERGYFTLDELLADLPGFQFRNIMSLNSYVFQRGIPNQNNLTLVLIDGVQVNELNSGGFYGGGQYNLSNIERVEVVYGPSSVAYGTNAVSGIINIITSKADKNEGAIHALAGSFNTHLSDVSFSSYLPDEKFGFRVSGMVKQSDKANLKSAEGDYNWTDLMDNFENDYSLDFKLNYNDFSFGSNYLQKQTTTATLFPSVGTGYHDNGTFWNIMFLNNYLKYEKALSPKLKLTTTLYNRNTTVLKNSIYYVLDTAQVGYYRPNNLTGFEGVLSYKQKSKFSVTGGLLLEYENLASSPSFTYSNAMEERPPVPEKPAMHSNFLASVFVEPNLILFNSLFLSGGIRFDQSTIYDQVLTPRLGIRYNLNNHSVRLNYAEAFRAPKPWDYTDGIGNPELKPENMHSIEASFSFALNKNFKIEMNAYQNRLENGILKMTIGDGYRWENSSKIVTLGTETSMRYTQKNLVILVNYSLTDSRDEAGALLPEISMHTANAIVTYSFSEKWKLNLRANYVGNRENPHLIKVTNSNLVDDFVIIGGAINWSPFVGFDIALIGKNLLDTEYYHTSNRMPDRYRQPQRTMLLSATYYFRK